MVLGILRLPRVGGYERLVRLASLPEHGHLLPCLVSGRGRVRQRVLPVAAEAAQGCSVVGGFLRAM